MTGHRDGARDRKACTRWLIEYGGLVAKAGLADRLADDRATFYGALLMLRDLLDGAGTDMPADLKVRWRRRGLRAFDADAAAKAAGKGGSREARTDGEVHMPSG